MQLLTDPLEPAADLLRLLPIRTRIRAANMMAVDMRVRLWTMGIAASACLKSPIDAFRLQAG